MFDGFQNSKNINLYKESIDNEIYKHYCYTIDTHSDVIAFKIVVWMESLDRYKKC